MAELGYSTEVIDSLQAEGVIGSGRPGATAPLIPATAKAVS
jgi:hypothetical protein